jgi:hypothetical protein
MMEWKDDGNGMTESRNISEKTIRVFTRLDDAGFEYKNCSYKIENGRISIYVLREERYTEEFLGDTKLSIQNCNFDKAEIASYPADSYCIEVVRGRGESYA